MFGKLTGRPDWSRVDRAQGIAFELMKAVPEGQRAPMLTLMGWLEWLKGRGSQADRYLRLATEDVPAFRLAVLLREMINRGNIAEVATNAETSYKTSNELTTSTGRAGSPQQSGPAISRAAASPAGALRNDGCHVAGEGFLTYPLRDGQH